MPTLGFVATVISCWLVFTREKKSIEKNMANVKRTGLEGRVVFLRNRGLTFSEIAEKVGYSIAHVQRLFKKCGIGGEKR